MPYQNLTYREPDKYADYSHLFLDLVLHSLGLDAQVLDLNKYETFASPLHHMSSSK